MSTKRKNRLFKLIAVLIGIFVGFLVVEISLRIIGYSYPDFYRPDETLGYTLIPNMTGTYAKEGRNFVRINSDGFHDVEHSSVKPADTIRLAIIGDSYVEAMQVAQEQVFSNYVSAEVQKCGAFGEKKVEVLTFAVSGYGTAQELILLREKVWKYSPDMVMLLITTNNDISDNSRAMKKAPIPYFVMRDGVLTEDDSFRNERSFLLRNSSISRLGTWFRNNLRTVQGIGQIQVWLKYKYGDLKGKPAASSLVAESPNEPAPVQEVGIDSQVYRPPATPEWEDAWRSTEGIIDLMKNEVTEHGSQFVVVTGSNGAQVLPNTEERRAFERLLGVNDLLYPDNRIASFCRSKSIPVITLAPFVADFAAREQKYLHGFEGNIGYGHWNQLGHRVAGEEIGREICGGR